jgi:hypothetical protein
MFCVGLPCCVACHGGAEPWVPRLNCGGKQRRTVRNVAAGGSMSSTQRYTDKALLQE